MKNVVKICFYLLCFCSAMTLDAQPYKVDGYLIVGGTYTQTFNNANRRYYGPGGEQVINNNKIKWAIQAFGEIDAHGYWANSDRRIKRNITDASPDLGLSIIQKLCVRNYNFKDSTERCTTPVLGFIAQEVESVFPQAVAQCTKVIPDMYQVNRNIVCDNTLHTLTVTMDSLCDLKKGDKVRIVGNTRNLVEVAEVNSNTFQVKDWPEQDTKEVFVYGKEVDDFNVVNYDRIFTLNVLATQALIKEVETLRKQVAEFATLAQVLKSENEGLKTTVQVIQDGLATHAQKIAKETLVAPKR